MVVVVVEVVVEEEVVEEFQAIFPVIVFSLHRRIVQYLKLFNE